MSIAPHMENYAHLVISHKPLAGIDLCQDNRNQNIPSFNSKV